MNTVVNSLGNFGNTDFQTQLIYLEELYSTINESSDGDTLKSYFINDNYNCLEYNDSPTIMHKYGARVSYYHDVGIVLDDNNPYIIIVLTNGANNGSNCGQNGGKSSSSSVTELSKKIYKLHKALS